MRVGTARRELAGSSSRRSHAAPRMTPPLRLVGDPGRLSQASTAADQVGRPRRPARPRPNSRASRENRPGPINRRAAAMARYPRADFERGSARLRRHERMALGQMDRPECDRHVAQDQARGERRQQAEHPAEAAAKLRQGGQAPGRRRAPGHPAPSTRSPAGSWANRSASHRICYSLSQFDFKEYRHGPTDCPPPTRSDPRAARTHADLPRLRRAALGRLQDPTLRHHPGRHRPAPAPGPPLPRPALPPPRRPAPPRAGGPLRPARSTSSASTSSP